MRQRMTLYIGGKKADINDDALILMNYTMEDLQNPSIVKNSYSQSVVLPSTDSNNKIFGEIYRSDRLTIAGGGVGIQFSAISKTPFEIISEDGSRLESGYVKVDSIERKGNDINYKVTLYGGLGAFLYGLMYDEDGNKKSLADLDYGTELTFDINKKTIRDAWRQQGGIAVTSQKWNIINFAPCYNGKPQGGFQANKAFIPSSVAGLKASTEVTSDNKTITYSARNGYVLATLSQEYDEWQTSDLRSYMQRPVIKMEKVIGAICDELQNGGYKVNLDSDFFASGNPYYERTYLTLPMLSDVKVDLTSGRDEAEVAQGICSTNSDVYVPIALPKVNTAIGTEYQASLAFTPALQANGQASGTNILCAWEYPDQPSGRNANRIVCLYQLLGYDADDKIICGSSIAMATTKMKTTDGKTNTYPSIISPEDFVKVWRRQNTYTEAWNGGYQLTSEIGDAYVVGSDGIARLQEGGQDKTILLTMKGNGIARMALRVTTLKGNYLGDASIIYSLSDNVAVNASFANVTIQGLGNPTTSVDYTYSTNGLIRSGATITQEGLLGGTASPADYLLSYCKMFGLHIVYDASDKSISILTRNNLYKDEVVDLTDYIDKSSVSVVPYILNSRWYKFGVQNVEGAFIDYYNSISNIGYGDRRVNTGYEFNADTTDVLKDDSIKGCADVLAQSKYYVHIRKDGKVFPSPLLDGGSYVLWNGGGETTSLQIDQVGDDAEITYLNTDNRGSDFPLAVKPQFADKDGKAKDGSNVLLMYDYSLVAEPLSRYCLTDDISLMSRYNGGEVCWLLAQSEVSGNADYCIGEALPMPLFHRAKTTIEGDKVKVTHSLDYGLPKELGAYNVEIQEQTTIYNKMWQSYIADRYDVDSRVMTCKANIKALREANVNLLRGIYYYDGALWVINAIKNLSINTDDLAEVQLVKVKNKDNYLAGQTYISASIIVEDKYVFDRLGGTQTFIISTSMVDVTSLRVSAPSWIDASISGNVLTLSANINISEDAKKGMVVISGVANDESVVTAQMEVAQIGAYKLTITPTAQYVGSRDFQEKIYDIQYEGEDLLSATSDAYWVNVAIYNNKTLVASANESNNTNANRTANIVVKGLGVSKSVTFTQNVGLSVNGYVPTLTSASLALEQSSPNMYILTGDSSYIGDVAMMLEVVVYIPQGNSVPSNLSAVINAGNNGGVTYNVSYIGMYAPQIARYEIDNAIPLSLILDGVTTGVLKFDTIGGDTLAMNQLYIVNQTN